LHLLIIVSRDTGETTRELYVSQQDAIARVAELEAWGHFVTTKGPQGYRF
jgi:hypothetical protein